MVADSGGSTPGDSRQPDAVGMPGRRAQPGGGASELCSRGVEIAASAVDDLARALGRVSRRVELPESQVGALALKVNVKDDVVAATARDAGASTTWRRISSSVSQLYNATNGPERSAVVATACDYFTDGSATAANLVVNLAKAHAGKVTANKLRLLVEDTNKLIKDLQKAANSSDPYERAAIPVLCYTVGQFA